MDHASASVSLSLITKLSQQLTHVGAVASARTAASCTARVSVPQTEVSLGQAFNVGMYLNAPEHLHYLAKALDPPPAAAKSSPPWSFYVLDL